MGRLLVGIGNYSMGDDSIGLRLVEYFSEHQLCGSYEPLLFNQDSTQLLFHMGQETEEILVVDCVRMGESPGTHRLFTPNDVESQKSLANFSSHEGDVLKVLALAKELGYPIPKIRILGIEPASTDFSFDLTPLLNSRFSDYIQILSSVISGSNQAN